MPKASRKKPIEQYEHLDKTRKNNPPAGLVTPDTDRDGDKKTYAYDPYLDPSLALRTTAYHSRKGDWRVSASMVRVKDARVHRRMSARSGSTEA